MKKIIIITVLSIVFGAGGYGAWAAILAPTNIVATPKSPTEIDVSWSTSTDAVSYEIYRNGTSTPIAAATSTQTGFSDSGLDPETTYTYYLTAVDASSTKSGLSAGAATSTLADTEAPTVPANLTAVLGSVAQANLGWDPSADNVKVAGYKIYRNNAFLATTTATSYANSGLAASTTYSYRVSAYDKSGNESDKSAAAAVTTAIDTEDPSVPANLSAAVISSSRINLSWSAATDNFGVTGYKIYRDGVLIAAVSALSYRDTGLAVATTYSYRLSAIDASGNESTKTPAVTVATFALSPGAATTSVQIAFFNGRAGKQINLISNQIVKIVVYSDSNCDACEILNKTVRFGGAKAESQTSGDFNKDGRADRIYSFRARDMKDLKAGDTYAKFSAQMPDGRWLYAELAVKVIGPKPPLVVCPGDNIHGQANKFENKIEAPRQNLDKRIEKIKEQTEKRIDKIEDKIEKAKFSRGVKCLKNNNKKSSGAVCEDYDDKDDKEKDDDD